ncbi:MAG: type II restriction endonuclease, partial [Pseudomonadota bacterium]
FTSADGTDVDGFISFSLSVQNRRKSRMGHSLENHMAAVLRAHDIRHVRGAITEHKHKPDFLFPDLETCQACVSTGRSRLIGLQIGKQEVRLVFVFRDRAPDVPGPVGRFLRKTTLSENN